MFVPFRNESDLIGDHCSAEQAFNHLTSSSSGTGKHHEKLDKMLKAQIKVREISKHRDATEEACSKKDVDEPVGLEIAREAAGAMDDVCHMDFCHADSFNLNERIKMLNSDQFQVFEYITGHLNHQWQHEQGVCHCNDLKPLYTYFYQWCRWYRKVLSYSNHQMPGCRNLERQ